MLRKSFFREPWAISAIAPANSTPVGPPPTMIKVSQARCFSGSVSFYAASKAAKMRRLISKASSTVFKPGATSCH